MDKATFCTELINMVSVTFPSCYNFQLTEIRKNNNTHLTAVVVKETSSPIGVTIYLDDYYDRYSKGTDITMLSEHFLLNHRNEIINTSLKIGDLDLLNNKNAFLSRVFFKIVNKDLNKDLLKEVPHKNLWTGCDWVMIFSLLAQASNNSIGTVTVNNFLMDRLDIGFAELVDNAYINTPKLFPASFFNMSDVIKNMLGEDDILEGVDISPMWILSNEQGTSGAGVLLYEGVIDSIGAKFKKNFFILPSSVHELILIPDDCYTLSKEQLINMVREVNNSTVSKEDYLSDTILYYNFVNKSLSVA